MVYQKTPCLNSWMEPTGAPCSGSANNPKPWRGDTRTMALVTLPCLAAASRTARIGGMSAVQPLPHSDFRSVSSVCVGSKPNSKMFCHSKEGLPRIKLYQKLSSYLIAKPFGRPRSSRAWSQWCSICSSQLLGIWNVVGGAVFFVNYSEGTVTVLALTSPSLAFVVSSWHD